jgi:hypothetical protein
LRLRPQLGRLRAGCSYLLLQRRSLGLGCGQLDGRLSLSLRTRFLRGSLYRLSHRFRPCRRLARSFLLAPRRCGLGRRGARSRLRLDFSRRLLLGHRICTRLL